MSVSEILPEMFPSAFFTAIRTREGMQFADTLNAEYCDSFRDIHHGDWQRWQDIVAQLPAAQPSSYVFDAATVSIGLSADMDERQQFALRDGLRQLMPWRKGPFCLFSIQIDGEWRSDYKWLRLAEHIQPLHDRRVLDVGCGNGYYIWRMFGAGAAWVLGLEPGLLALVQFFACYRYVRQIPVAMIPLRLEKIAAKLHNSFDSVFSMGVVYHQPQPQQHLEALYSCLRPGGELILESLILDKTGSDCLQPAAAGLRYAMMNNVYCVPTPEWLLQCLRQAGFASVRVVDVTPTKVTEQHRSDWMQFHSLDDFLDRNDPTRTYEGYPAPVRAIFIAERPC